MRAFSFLNTFILLICMYACSGNSNTQKVVSDSSSDNITRIIKDSFPRSQVMPVVAITNSSQSYALYIPAGNMDSMAVVFFFDPHADGVLPLTKYKSLADQYHYILIGSNDSKNGNDWSTTDNIWNTLFSDVQQRISFNKSRIYVCGFSGGAKVASHIALQNGNIKGVIADGAGLPDATPSGNFNFSFTAIAGKGDMNMTDLVELNNQLSTTNTLHRIILFNGKHEWAPENLMNTAFQAWQVDAMRSGIIGKDDAFINHYTTESKKKTDALASSNKLIDAANECALSVSVLNGISNNVEWFKSKEASLKSNSLYKQQLQQQQILFDKEQQMKATFNQQFQQGDINYWSKTIGDLQNQSIPQTEEAAMYQRLLAYLSLAFYSISNQFINSNQNDAAAHFVELYKMADSTNSEAWYFSALLNAKNKNINSTKTDLEKAIHLGFTDKQRLLQQPEFESIATQINLTQILSETGK